MNIDADRMARTLAPLWPVALGAAILGWWSPLTLAGVVTVAGCASAVTRKLFTGLGLAVAAAPLGFWLIEHPSPLAVLLCAAVCCGMVWWYRDSIRASL